MPIFFVSSINHIEMFHKLPSIERQTKIATVAPLTWAPAHWGKEGHLPPHWNPESIQRSQERAWHPLGSPGAFKTLLENPEKFEKRLRPMGKSKTCKN
jgi:hypothetical protein